MEYKDFQTSMTRWSQKPVPPVMSVGTLWRITSPLSLWSDMSGHIGEEEIEELKNISVKDLKLIDTDTGEDITEAVIKEIPVGIETVDFKLSFELPDEDVNE